MIFLLWLRRGLGRLRGKCFFPYRPRRRPFAANRFDSRLKDTDGKALRGPALTTRWTISGSKNRQRPRPSALANPKAMWALRCRSPALPPSSGAVQANTGGGHDLLALDRERLVEGIDYPPAKKAKMAPSSAT